MRYIDSIVCTMNPSLLHDGSNASHAPPPQTNPQLCNKAFTDVTDYNLDPSQLVATCQRHTVCSEAYCLKQKNGQQSCKFGYPKELQPETVITPSENGDIELATTRNDPLVNSFHPI